MRKYPSVKYPFLITVLFFLAGPCLKAQQRLGIKALERDPLVSLSFDISRYLNTYKDTTLNPAFKEHGEKMRRGTRYSIGATFHFQNDFSIGPEYFHAYTADETEDFFLLINGSINAYGSIREEVTQNFYGLRVQKNFDLFDFQLAVSFTPGLLYYVRHADIAGYKYYAKGQDMSVDLDIQGIFEISKNWEAYLQVSYLASNISRPLYHDFTGRRVYLPPIPNSSFRAGVGLRFSILEPIRRRPAARPKRPEGPKDERFR